MGCVLASDGEVASELPIEEIEAARFAVAYVATGVKRQYLCAGNEPAQLGWVCGTVLLPCVDQDNCTFRHLDRLKSFTVYCSDPGGSEEPAPTCECGTIVDGFPAIIGRSDWCCAHADDSENNSGYSATQTTGCRKTLEAQTQGVQAVRAACCAGYNC
jgi:hypothetical protein